jgi:O-antigen ligase
MEPVKQKIGWLWQNAEKILIVLFFATFTLNIRKVFLTQYSLLNGGFNEYLTLNISWADVLMILVIFIYTIKVLYYQYHTNNTSQHIVIRFLSSVINPYYGQNVSRETFWLLLFLGWAGLSVFWSQFWPIAAYRFLILIEILLFAYISAKAINSPKWLRASFLALILNGAIQSWLGIAQFAKNGSIGLHMLGESIIGPNIAGVAKVIINGEKHIRAYGTFPHPNILAGFLIIPLFLLLAELATRLKNVSRETFLDFVPRWLLFVLTGIVATGFFMTLSRSAFLGTFIGLAFFIFLLSLHTPPAIARNEATKRSRILQNCSELLRFARNDILILAIIAFVFVAPLLNNYTSFFSSQSVQERNLFQIVSYETISSHPIEGIGLGNFSYYEFITHPNLESWQYQPVHNVFLLIFSELGFVGLTIFLLMLLSQLKKFQRRGEEKHSLTTQVFYCILFSFLAVSLFDHYFWDIKTGTLIFILPFVLFHMTKKIDRQKT